MSLPASKYDFHDYASLEAQRKKDRDNAPTLIGIGGLFGAGKDVVADHLVDTHGFVKLGMSDALADALAALNPIITFEANVSVVRYRDLLNEQGYVEAKKNPEVRRLLQVLGTEVGRNIISDTVWVDIMKKRVSEARAAGHPVIVTGMRFPNELEAIRSLGGHLWWVSRPSTESENVGGVKSHASEQSVNASQFDQILDNTGTIEDLQILAGYAVEALS